MYLCLKQEQKVEKQGYALIPIRQEDMESIRLWRNAQQVILRQNRTITKEEQKKYFHQSIFPLFQKNYPEQILFSYLYQDKLIGYGGLVWIDWENKRAEISFLVDPIRTLQTDSYKQDFSCFLAMICSIAFIDLRCHRLYAETFAFRKDHIEILEKQGFQKEGILKEHIWKNEEWIDSILHGQLAKEWKKSEE